MREFRRRRLAVVAWYLIVTLITISILAPFLANDRPIYYRGFNRFEYRESMRTLAAMIGNLLRATTHAEGDAAKRGVLPAERSGKSVVDRQQLSEIVDRQFEAMAAAVVPEQANALEQSSRRLADLIQADASTDIADELKQYRIQLRREFDARNMQFTSQDRWPALAMLTGSQFLFVVLAVMFLMKPVWLMLVRRLSGHVRGGFAVNCVILLVVPGVCGWLWWLFVPERVDRTDYKAGVLAVDDEDRRSPVVYHEVVWPPIPFGLDEDNLNIKYSRPGALSPEPSIDAISGSATQPLSTSQWDQPHWLGTDGIGRDVLSRMIWGGRVSLSVGIVAVSIYVTIGIIVGSIAGYFRGGIDLVVSRIIEIVICFPYFFLILTIVAFLGPSIYNIMLVIGLTGWTGVARLVRGEFLRLGEQEFVLAGRALGYSPLRIIFRHVLPNALAPVLVSATFGIAGAILIESGLSFLGFGITVPTPSWGGILSSGRDAIFRAPWLIYFPGLTIFITITAYNLVGEAFRDAADPRLRGQYVRQ